MKFVITPKKEDIREAIKTIPNVTGYTWDGNTIELIGENIDKNTAKDVIKALIGKEK